MNQLVDNLFWSFAGQFLCSRKDSSDSPLPHDVRFPSLKGCSDNSDSIYSEMDQQHFFNLYQRAYWRARQKQQCSHPLHPLSKCSPTSQTAPQTWSTILTTDSHPISSTWWVHWNILNTLQYPCIRTLCTVCEKLCLGSCEGFRCITLPRFFPQQPLLCQITTCIPPLYHPLSCSHCDTVLTHHFTAALASNWCFSPCRLWRPTLILSHFCVTCDALKLGSRTTKETLPTSYHKKSSAVPLATK